MRALGQLTAENLSPTSIVGEVALGEVSENFSFLCRHSGDLFGQLLDLTDQVLLPHEVLVGIGWGHVGPLLLVVGARGIVLPDSQFFARQRLFVVGERGVNSTKGTT